MGESSKSVSILVHNLGSPQSYFIENPIFLFLCGKDCFFLYIILLLFIYFCLCLVPVAAHRLSLIAMSGGYFLVTVPRHLIGLASLLQSTGSRVPWASVVAARGLSS